MSSVPKKHQSTPAQWAEVKAKAKADLEFRLSHGLPHSDKPLQEVKVAADPKPPKAPKAPKAPKPGK